MPQSNDAATDRLSLELPVDLDAVEQARLALLDYLAPFDLSDRTINRIEVVLEELLSNVVRHAGEVHLLRLHAHRLDGCLELTVEDDGPAFNPLAADAPERFASLEEAQLGGQGIVLVRKLSREVSYERRDSRNRISALLAA